MQIVVDRPLDRAARWALSELTDALRGEGGRPEIGTAPTSSRAVVVGVAGKSPLIDEYLSASGVACPAGPESLVIHWAGNGCLIAAGRDDRGLAYALTEVARAVQLSDGDDPLGGIENAIESPELPWRSMQLFLCNEALEREWYFRRGFWEGYLGQLARCRYNNFSLTFAHQTPYLAPPYPFLVEMDEFPEVTTPDCSEEQRERNLSALQMIAEMSQERGLHFTLGIWSQHAHSYGEPRVQGLRDEALADFNAGGLRKVLSACPLIDGVQLRMNVESGIPEDEQLAFYEKQFRVIAECGRPVRLDLRAKGLSDETIRSALDIVPDTVVSTKFWCEHLGMPYVMPAIQQFDVEHYRRYGTWDLLRKPRAFGLQHRLWSAGSQRVLLWGDPEWVRRFVRACRVGETGFEVMAPLTNKGFEGESQEWAVIGDQSCQPYDEEYERYWMFYLLFGRLGYSSQTPDRIWLRELSARFGEAAEHVAVAYHESGKILPMITTVLQWSASLWGFWPEMFCGRSLREDLNIEPSDPTQFYGVAEYVDDAISGCLCGKWTPFQVAEYLRSAAADTRKELDAAEKLSPLPGEAEYRGTALDFHLAALLADYHADRLIACVHFAFHDRTGSVARLQEAVRWLKQARGHWQALSELADGIYHHDLCFGRHSFRHDGHWKDRLQEIDRELGDLAEELARGRREAPSRSEEAYLGEAVPADRIPVSCEVPDSVTVGETLSVRLTVQSADQPRVVRCYYRDAHQALAYGQVEMRGVGDRRYEAQIPARSISGYWDLMFFFEVIDGRGEGARHPDWRETTPYYVVTTGSRSPG